MSCNNLCEYLWISKWVSILAYLCGADFVLMITLVYVFISAVIIFVIIEFYADELFKKLDLQEDEKYHLNKSLILYREHKKLCTG